MKKIILIIIAGIIIIGAGIGGYFIFKKLALPSLPVSIGKCGDNVCDEFERANPNACPSECLSAQSSQTSSYLDSPFGTLPFFSFIQPVGKNAAPPGPEKFDFRPTEDLGIKWGRAHYLTWQLVQPTKEDVDGGVYDWSSVDAVIGSFPEGMNVVENIIGFSVATTDKKGAPSHGFSFPNKNVEDSFALFIRKAVERYDGDGKDDMPDLKSPIKYWQVENEPDFLGSKDLDGFANLQKITYEAVKSVCPDCKVLLGGMAGEIKGLKEFFIPVVSSLGGKYFDIFDYHCYGHKADWNKCGHLAEEIRKTFPNNNFEIWLTETGTWSGSVNDPSGGQPSPKQTEKDQAEALVKFYIYPISNGVKKIFWAWGILEGFDGSGDTLFNKTGLIYDGQDSDDLGFGVKKLAYYTYKKMVEILEGSDWDNIQTIQEQGGVYVYKFLKGDKPIWVAWNDNTSEKQITISGVNSSSVKVTEAVPNYESGKEVKDYNTAFKTEIKQITGIKLTITLSGTPVFVEEN